MVKPSRLITVTLWWPRMIILTQSQTVLTCGSKSSLTPSVNMSSLSGLSCAFVRSDGAASTAAFSGGGGVLSIEWSRSAHTPHTEREIRETSPEASKQASKQRTVLYVIVCVMVGGCVNNLREESPLDEVCCKNGCPCQGHQ